MKYLKITSTILFGTMAIFPLTSASASIMTATQASKIKVANMVYAKTITKAKLDFRVAIKPSYDAVLAVGKPADLVRRAKVRTALVSFNSIVAVEKAPSIMAEKAYKVIILKLVKDPANVQLKEQSKTALLSLKATTALLKVDAKVKMARLVFEKARIKAMMTFKLVTLKAVKARQKVQTIEIAKFNIKKIKAQSTLKATIKMALAGK